MPRIKTESKTPLPRTPAPEAGGGRGGSSNNGDSGPNNGSGGGRRSRGVHPAMMLSNKKMEEILRCDEVHLDMVKHAAYKIMKDEPTIKRRDLRMRLAAQEQEFESMLSGERWEGQDYPEERTFEEDLDMLLIKIMSIARQKLKREAKKKKQPKRELEDEGYATTSPSKSLSPRSKDNYRAPQQSPSRKLSNSDLNRRASSNAEEEQEEDLTMSGGAGNNDDAVAPTGLSATIEGANDQEEDQTPSGGVAGGDNIFDTRDGGLQDTLCRNISMRSIEEEEEEFEGIFGTPTPRRSAREQARRNRNRLIVRRQSTRAFGVQDVIDLD